MLNLLCNCVMFIRVICFFLTAHVANLNMYVKTLQCVHYRQNMNAYMTSIAT